MRRSVHSYFAILIGIFIIASGGRVHASATNGTIDPGNTGAYLAKLYQVAGHAGQELEINFGKFTTQSAKNITISDAGIRGYAWSSLAGWIVTNCADTTSGCSSSNGNFKIAVSASGVLSGYAWGENTGWINFGPFTNNSAAQVKIGSDGAFGGTSGNAGYAWAQNFGWIVFDCTDSNSCVKTDYIPADDRTTDTGGGGGGGGGDGSTPACSDHIDNDGDGFTDYPADIGCVNGLDNDETNTIIVTPPPAACADGIDNDGDGLIDYPLDPGCDLPSDTDESNTIVINPQQFICSDGIDNDNDGLIDYPNDPGCSDAKDNDETDGSIITTTDDGSGDGGTGTHHTTDDGGGSVIDVVSQVSNIVGHAKSTTVVSVTALGVVTAVSIAATLVDSPFLFSDLWLLLLRLWAFILSLFGLKKSARWGVVYDAETKQPIDPAYVVLKDMTGKEISTAITDINGRYGFLVAAGTYTITAQKTHYQFPSKLLAGRESDELYKDLYFGEPILVARQDAVVAKNIPMDPLDFDWNEFIKVRRGITTFFIRHELTIHRVSDALFAIGFILSLASLITVQSLTNIIVFGLYVFFAILKGSGVLRPKTSTVLNAEGVPQPFVLVEVVNATIDQLITKKVASVYGRFFALVPNGKYYLKISKKSTDPAGGYIPVYTTDPFTVTEGFIHRRIVV